MIKMIIIKYKILKIYLNRINSNLKYKILIVIDNNKILIFYLKNR